MVVNMEDVAASLEAWDFASKLPEEIASFRKIPGKGIEGQILTIISYIDEAHHRQLDLIYTGETDEYVPVKVIGLHSFRDERYFCRDKEKFAQLMLNSLPQLLEEISSDKKTEYPYQAKALHFEKWEYWRSLPQKIGNFEMYITPDNPIKFINGSYIFLDYTDFKHGNQLCFLFNTFRMEIFAEMLQANVPITTATFTVPEENPEGERDILFRSDKLLEAFTVLLKNNLEADLNKLSRNEF